jgi:hypothetical protein
MRRLLALSLLLPAVPQASWAFVNHEMTDELARRPVPFPRHHAAPPKGDQGGDVVVIPLRSCDSGCPLQKPRTYHGVEFYRVSQHSLLEEVGKFYESHQDRYDVLVSFTMFHTGNVGGAYYMPIANDITGINGGHAGRGEIYSYAASLGSKELHGFVYMGDMYQCDFMQAMGVPLACSERPPFPESSYSLMGVMGQELGHQWGSFVRFKDRTTGAESLELLGRDSSHWSYLTNSGGSPLEGNAWKEVSPGSFQLQPTPKARFSELDQYLMGLRPPGEVSDSFFVRAPSPAVNPTAPPGSSARKVTGTRVNVSIADIVAVEGARAPAYETSPKTTREAFLLFVVEGTTAAAVEKEVRRVREVRRAWRAYWYDATDRRGRVRSVLSGRDDFLFFDFKVNPEGWTLSGGPAFADGSLHLVPGAKPGAHAALHADLDLDPAEYQSLLVTMTVPPELAGKGLVEYAPVKATFAEGGEQRFQALTDGKAHTYHFALGKQAKWAGRIGALRITATDAPGDGVAKILIDRIEGLPTTAGDDDDDALPDAVDNCRFFKNPDQKDADGNGVGDVCEAALDRDRDGVPDTADNCVDLTNSLQEDADQDGVGDACEPDSDGDGVIDDKDNCKSLPNKDQADRNSDGVGDACAPDRDADGLADEIDNCPGTANPDQADRNGDGVGDACAADRDGDAVADEIDNCPDVPNAGQADANKDGVGDACDPATAVKVQPGCGCGTVSPSAPLLAALLALPLFRRRRFRRRNDSRNHSAG